MQILKPKPKGTVDPLYNVGLGPLLFFDVKVSLFFL